MDTFKPLFVTGTARSGSTLLCRMLSAHPDVMLASDPYLPLFRSLRDAVLLASGQSDPLLRRYVELPFQDYYFTQERIRALDAIQSGNLSTTFDLQTWPYLQQAIASRAQSESPDLIPSLPELAGPTYRALIDNGLAIIARARAAENREWVGLKDVWVLELFALLASAYPNARFIVLLRDPRATLASMVALSNGDNTQIAHPLSFARHWRKYVAFARHYENLPVFKGRLHIVTYEHLVSQPLEASHDLCNFLEIGYHPDMLDPDKYIDYSTGEVWKGNSSFEKVLKGIATSQKDRWRESLDPAMLRLIELVCGPEMSLAGYESTPLNPQQVEPEVLKYIIWMNEQTWNWRSDLEDPQQDYSFEWFRHALLGTDEPPSDELLIRRSFLFEDVFRLLRKQRPLQAKTS